MRPLAESVALRAFANSSFFFCARSCCPCVGPCETRDFCASSFLRDGFCPTGDGGLADDDGAAAGTEDRRGGGGGGGVLGAAHVSASSPPPAPAPAPAPAPESEERRGVEEERRGEIGRSRSEGDRFPERTSARTLRRGAGRWCCAGVPVGVADAEPLLELRQLRGGETEPASSSSAASSESSTPPSDTTGVLVAPPPPGDAGSAQPLLRGEPGSRVATRMDEDRPEGGRAGGGRKMGAGRWNCASTMVRRFPGAGGCHALRRWAAGDGEQLPPESTSAMTLRRWARGDDDDDDDGGVGCCCFCCCCFSMSSSSSKLSPSSDDFGSE